MADTLAPLSPPRRLLFGPGPSLVEPRVYEAMSKPIVSHLDPYFFRVVEDIRNVLRKVFGTSNEFTLVMSATGSGGMQTSVANFVEPKSKFAVLANGYFCDRISDMGRRCGANVVRLEKHWGETFADAEVREFLHRERPQTVAYVQAETSTGAFQHGVGIGAAAHEVGALVIADAVTSLGGMPVQADAMGIDIAYSCTQKALACVPGLSPITVSARAMDWLRARKSPIPDWYFDLKLLDEYYHGAAHRYHHTTPISSFYALREALAVIAEETVEKRWARHLKAHRAFVAGIEAMGLSMHVPEPHRLWTLNTPRVPEGVDDVKVRRRMMAEDDIEILGGFGPLAGKIFRIGLMGMVATRENVLLLLESLQKSLMAEGFTARGNGREAAEAVFSTTA